MFAQNTSSDMTTPIAQDGSERRRANRSSPGSRRSAIGSSSRVKRSADLARRAYAPALPNATGAWLEQQVVCERALRGVAQLALFDPERVCRYRGRRGEFAYRRKVSVREAGSGLPLTIAVAVTGSSVWLTARGSSERRIPALSRRRRDASMGNGAEASLDFTS